MAGERREQLVGEAGAADHGDGKEVGRVQRQDGEPGGEVTSRVSSWFRVAKAGAIDADLSGRAQRRRSEPASGSELRGFSIHSANARFPRGPARSAW